VYLYETDQGRHFRIFGLNGSKPPVQVGDFPEGPGGRPLHADDKLAGLLGIAVDGVGNHAGHDRAHKAHAHYDDDFPAQLALFGNEFLEADEFCGFIFLTGKRKCSPAGQMEMGGSMGNGAGSIFLFIVCFSFS